MGIQSHAFGRVTLTDEDARKFMNQVKHGRPNDAAKTAVKQGSSAVKEFQSKGSVRIVLKAKAK